MNQEALTTTGGQSATLPMPCNGFTEIAQLGKALALSTMFGCKTVEQGVALAVTCYMERMTPFQFKRKFHIIEGNLSMRADAMLAEFNNRGGSHEILERTPEVASVKLIDRNDLEYTFTFTWEEAQKEPFPYRKDGKTLKHNWATPRARMQLLWARVTSDAVRAVDPAVVAGVYTPEEVQDFDAPAPVTVKDITDQVEAEPAMTVLPPEEPPVVEPPEAETVIPDTFKTLAALREVHGDVPRDQIVGASGSYTMRELDEDPEPPDAGENTEEGENGAPEPGSNVSEMHSPEDGLLEGIEDFDKDDMNLMPVGRFAGNHWARFKDLQLEAILAKDTKAITKGHRDIIVTILKERGEG